MSALGDVLDGIEPQALRAADTTSPGATPAVPALTGQQLVEASRELYQQHQPLMDAAASNLLTIVQTQPAHRRPGRRAV